MFYSLCTSYILLHNCTLHVFLHLGSDDLPGKECHVDEIIRYEVVPFMGVLCKQI